MRREAPVYNLLKVNIPAEASLPTLASGNFSTSALVSASHSPSDPTTTHPTKITKAILLRMYHLAHSDDVRSTRLEVVLPWMIEDYVDYLTVRVTTCEVGRGSHFR